MDFRTYALTIRPQNGVTDDEITPFMKWVRKKCLYYHVITEKEGSSRHIHAALFLTNPTPRNSMCTMLKNLFKDFTPSEKQVMLKGIKVMYNMDWIQNYLDKDDDTEVIGSSLPEAGHIESYFPEKPSEPTAKRRKICSAYYHELEKLWYEHVSPDCEKNTPNARAFLSKMMYKERCINVIRDDKAIHQTARHLVRFLGKIDDDVWELPPFEKEEGY